MKATEVSAARPCGAFFFLLYKLIPCFELVSLEMKSIQIKPTEQYFTVVLFFSQSKVSFDSFFQWKEFDLLTLSISSSHFWRDILP